MKRPLALALGLTIVSSALALSALQQKPGYTDTPMLPDQKWRVHDSERPYPAVVTPGAGTAPPSDAIVLFDGKDLSHWAGDGGKPAAWTLVDGAMEVNGSGTIQTKDVFGDCQIHIEWATPAKVEGHSQERGNSGVYLMGRYELQVLDSFDNATYADGSAGAMYGQFPPLVNACRKPGEWQTYDIVFHAPKFQDGKLQAPGRVTLLHNGVLVQDDRAFLGSTEHRKLAQYAPHEPQGPIALQDHGTPVRYRNIWLRKL